MRTYKSTCFSILLSLLVSIVVAHAQDPLPSWNNGAAKQAILNFVRTTTDASSPNFVPAEQRLATFDQDGTSWVEHPMYTQFIFAFERVVAWLRSIRSGRPQSRLNRSLPVIRRQ